MFSLLTHVRWWTLLSIFTHVGQGCFDCLVHKTNIIFVEHGSVLCIHMRNDHFYAAFIDGLLGFVGNVVDSKHFSINLSFLLGSV